MEKSSKTKRERETIPANEPESQSRDRTTLEKQSQLTSTELLTSRRRFPRKDIRLDVSLFSDSNFYAGFTENLSAGGVFVATHDRLAIGETVNLTITLPDGGELKAHGIVRWLRDYSETSDAPPGMGIQFVTMEGKERLLEFTGLRSPLFFDDDSN